MKFVLCVAGPAHVEQLNRALSFLKEFTRKDIIVVATRASEINHDNVVSVEIDEPSNFKASRLIKTSLPKLLGNGLFCYLDNDIFTVYHPDKVFSYFVSPVTFCTDHVLTVKKFSHWSVKNKNLSKSINDKFGIEVDNNWRIWNGGVFLFNEDSHDFFATWHAYTRQVFQDDNWWPRDQGTLVATVWQYGLQNHERIPPEYNWIVNRTDLIEDKMTFDGKMFKTGRHRIRFLHFIHNGELDDQEQLGMVNRFWRNRRRLVL